MSLVFGDMATSKSPKTFASLVQNLRDSTGLRCERLACNCISIIVTAQ